MLDSGTGQPRSASARPSVLTLTSVCRPGQPGRLLRHPGAERSRQLGHDHIRPGQRDAPVGGQAVVGYAVMAFPWISLTDPQRGDRAPAEDRGRVHRLAAGHPREAPPGSGAEVAGPLGHDDHVGAQHVPGGQQPGVQGDGFQVAAEGLADGHRPSQPARFAQPRAGPGKPRGQRAAVEHHVCRDRRAATGAAAGRERGAQRRRRSRQRRVQVGDHHGHPADVVGGAQHLVVGRVLLVGTEHGGLQRRVPRLDQVARAGRIRGEPVGQRHDQRVAAGPQAERERAGIQQQPVTGFAARPVSSG